MANPEQLSMLGKGNRDWNICRTFNPKARLDLTKADLRAMNLSATLLGEADLELACLQNANLLR